MAKIKRLRNLENSRFSLDAAKSMEEEFKNQYGTKVLAKAMFAYHEYEQHLKETEKNDNSKLDRQNDKLKLKEQMNTINDITNISNIIIEKYKNIKNITVDNNALRLTQLYSILNNTNIFKKKEPIWRSLPIHNNLKIHTTFNNLTPLHLIIARTHK